MTGPDHNNDTPGAASYMGSETLPLTMMEKVVRHANSILSQDILFALQAALLGFGFWIAVKVVLSRGPEAGTGDTRGKILNLTPILVFAVAVTGFHLWILMQPMGMRM